MTPYTFQPPSPRAGRTSTLLTRTRSTAPIGGEPPATDSPAQPPALAIGALRGSAGFATLLGAYRGSGGTARGEDLAVLLEAHQRGDYVNLARLIAAGEAFGFEWRQTLWIPMFQFDPRDLTTRKGVAQVLAATPGAIDGWTVAGWFVQPNAHLGGQRPIDLFAIDLPAVVDAARSSSRDRPGAAT